MHPVRRQRLFLVLFIVIAASIVVGLGISALGTNMNLFYTPTQIANGEVPDGARIRAGGMVVKGSVEESTESLFVSFQVTDGPHQLDVHYTGIRPDLFAEGEAALAVGVIDANGVLQAEEVLAKHDENYTPPEIQQAMEEGHRWQQEPQQLNNSGEGQ
ncbi:MAG: cytochrome c maturation protein CcmE, partial [Porticoccaceae bacterium]|nr:cytochrome c maturation protein CcmE [Porticoccaceae bacterium]